MKLIATVLTAAGVMVSVPALASLDLAKKSNCMACHTVEKRLVGPSYQEIAKRYAGNKDAVRLLSEKVKKGGKDVWGPIPMPPNPAVKDADIETLVRWILAGSQ